MSYYIRILGTRDPDIYPDDLRAALVKQGLTAILKLDREGQPEQWKNMEISNATGTMLARIERNPVVEGDLGKEELDEFRELIQVHQPVSAVQWLGEFFDKVKVIYAFEVMETALQDDHYSVVSELKSAIWERVGGILQDDNEGFSNEEGFHILWQFGDEASGDKYCAVLGVSGEWERFRMDLGDRFQRMAFWNGEVPQMARRL